MTKIPRSQLRPGDLVFTPDLGHVGIYAGYGSMWNAPHTGASVRLQKVYVHRLPGRPGALTPGASDSARDVRLVGDQPELGAALDEPLQPEGVDRAVRAGRERRRPAPAGRPRPAARR